MKIGRFILSWFLVASVSLPSFACSEDGTGGIAPENNLNIPVNTKGPQGLSEEQYDSVIAEIYTIYFPLMARQGVELSIMRKWKDGTVNANATRNGKNWIVTMFGGMARHPSMSRDGFALVVCHELGHHLGGAPKKKNRLGISSWATNEGQADYFGTLKCLRQVFLNDDNAAVLKTMTIPQTIVTSCRQSWKTKADFNICVRSAMAGLSLSKVLQGIAGGTKAPSFGTPATNVVSVTFDSHPAAQCRLDTYLQGAVCPVDETVQLSNTNERLGVCHPSNGHSTGLRPACWYKSL